MMKNIIDVLSEVKIRCNGMLPIEAYYRLYEEGKKCAAGGDVVEVGTAHAAATICIGLGLLESKSFGGKVYTFEKIEGGSREEFGGVTENVSIIKDNLAHFGVSELVELVIGDVSETFESLPQSSKIAMLVLDSDGRIDRDFSLFFDRVINGGSIVIDDYQDSILISKSENGGLLVDQKHKLTYNLLNLFLKEGYMEKNYDTIGQTVFLSKATLDSSKSVNGLESAKIINAYRELVFSEAEKNSIKLILRHRLLKLIKKNFPSILYRYYAKRLRPLKP